MSQERLLIAAMAARRVMGRGHGLPWSLPGDMAHFRAVTTGHALIMGRRTYLSIGAPLPDRRTLVLSTDPDFHPAPGIGVFHSLPTALAACTGEAKVFLIGGARVFREGMALVDTILLSVIDLEVEGDVFFPEIPMDRFHLAETRRLALDPPVRLETYRRTPDP